MKPKKRSLLYLVLAFLFVISGCAAFREGNVPRARMPAERATDKQPSIAIQMSGAVILDSKIYQAHPKAMKTWTSQTIKAYEESGRFSEVTQGGSGTDLHAEVVIVDRGNPNRFFAFITGLTLYIIPSKASDEFTVKTTISDEKGNIFGAFEKSETVTLWQQLLLVLAMPFNWPESVAREALYDLNHATIKEAYGLGML